MKLLAAGCLHNNNSFIEELAEQAEREQVDLVVLCGDLTLGERSTENIVGPFKKRNKQVALVPGNHETSATADFLARRYNAINLHGYSYSFGDIALFGCGGANVGVHQLSENELFYTLKQAHAEIKNASTRIMVTHVHPSDSRMEKFSQFVPGSQGVKRAIDEIQPDLLLCSHVHEASGLEEHIGKTKVVNVAKRGTIITI